MVERDLRILGIVAHMLADNEQKPAPTQYAHTDAGDMPLVGEALRKELGARGVVVVESDKDLPVQIDITKAGAALLNPACSSFADWMPDNDLHDTRRRRSPARRVVPNAKRAVPPVPNGLRPFVIHGVTIHALNQRNAEKKYKKLK